MFVLYKVASGQGVCHVCLIKRELGIYDCMCLQAGDLYLCGFKGVWSCVP